ncbi:MAG: SCO7613 C-terminal domain-containing membrane protein [Aeromicrobium sp.]
MTFAEPLTCLSCRGSIEEGASACPHCGLDLTSDAIQNAWRSLVVADQWVGRARELARQPPQVRPEPPVASPAASPVPGRRPSLSAGTVLLVLGAVSLLVAGLIFITVSWGSMGILGRAVSLLAFTSIVGALATVVTRRALRGSAEALWTVFLGLLTLDWFAACDQGLFGLDALPGGYIAGVWGAVLLVAGVIVVRAGRPRLGKILIAPAIAAGAAPVIGAGGVVGELISDGVFWWAFATGVVAGLVTVLHRRLTLKPAFIVALVGTAILATVAVIAAFVEAADHADLRELVLGRHGLPLLIVVIAAAAVGRLTAGPMRSVAVTVAVLAAAALVALPADDRWPMRAAFVVAVVVVVACARAGSRPGAASAGLRWAGGIVAMASALGALPFIGHLVDVALRGAFGPRSGRLSAAIASSPGSDPGAWWVSLVVAVGLGGGLLLARRWPDLGRAERHLRAAAVAILGLGAAAAVAAALPPVVSFGGSLVLLGGLVSFANRRAPIGWRHLGPSVVALAPIATFSSWPASLIVWPMAVAVLTLAELHESDAVVRWSGRGFAAWWASLVPGVVMAYLGHSGRPMALAIIGAGVVVVLIGATLLDRDRPVAPIDLGAGAAIALGLILGASGGLDALPWTVAGAGVTIAGLLNRRRRWCRWAGPALLGVAYVVRLADSGVHVVEAYTAPFAVLLLIVGLWAMRNAEVSSLRALAPGVTLALLPSLPQALDDPTSLRALLLGLAAIAMLGLGLVKRWRAPFIGGAAVALLLVLGNISPWALGLPRWILIAAVGAVAIAIGATWESRVRNGRTVASYVSAMR